jgi:hypothetical protein
LFSLLRHGFREVDIQVRTQAHCHQCAALVVQLLHNDKAACVQVSQTENHATLCRSLIANITRVGTITAQIIDFFAYYFKFKVGLGGGGLDIRSFTFVIPKENFCQIIASEVIII